MASNVIRFERVYVTTLLASMAMGTLLATLNFPSTSNIGGAELVCGAMFAPSVAVIVAVIQFWLWAPFEPIQIAIAQRARELGPIERSATSFARSQLLRGALTSITLFLSVAGMGGMAHVEGRRNLALVEQLRLAESAAFDIGSRNDSGIDEVVVDEADLPPLDLTDQSSRAKLEVSPGHTEVIAAAPIGDGRWVLSRADVDEQVGGVLLLAVVVGSCLSIPLLGTTMANTRAQLDQIGALGGAMRLLIATGKIRGTTRITPRSNAEFDALVDDFNTMLDMLDELTDAASKVASGDLRNQLERPGDLHDAFRAMVERLHAMVVQIRSTSLDLASAASEIHSITQEQERAVNQQSLRMREVSDTVASLASSAESITRTSADVLDNADQTLRTTNAMILRIGELGAQAASVGQLLDLIREIADRSDLLALNGSLEATRVGEAGRGFALVAAEMRRLAERVTQTVGDVRERVVEIKTAGSNTVVVAEDSRKLAEQTASAARQISQVTHRQSRETELAAQTVHEITGVVIATAGATSQTRAAAEGLREQAEQLERLTRQFTLRTPGESAS
ncbi:methyl-accepting chemotaxis protein [Nannocystaceae bacterium ST9]